MPDIRFEEGGGLGASLLGTPNPYPCRILRHYAKRETLLGADLNRKTWTAYFPNCQEERRHLFFWQVSVVAAL